MQETQTTGPDMDEDADLLALVCWGA